MEVPTRQVGVALSIDGRPALVSSASQFSFLKSSPQLDFRVAESKPKTIHLRAGDQGSLPTRLRERMRSAMTSFR